MSWAAVILAAGQSRRMGQPKLLLPWGNQTILSHLIELWQNLGADRVLVVHRPGDEALLEELAKAGSARVVPLVNPIPEASMLDSIRVAAAWPEWDALKMSQVTLVLGDQPHLKRATLASLMEAALAAPEFIWQPSRNGRGRHPVVLPRADLQRLSGSGCDTLKQFLEAEKPRIRFQPSDDPAFDLDLDRPEDYQKAITLYLEKP